MNQATKALDFDHNNVINVFVEVSKEKDAVEEVVDKRVSQVTVIEVSDAESDDQFEIAYNKEEGELNPWSLPFVGIPINYFSVGLIYTGSICILYSM